MSRPSDVLLMSCLVSVAACGDGQEGATVDEVQEQVVACQASLDLLSDEVGALRSSVEALQTRDLDQDGRLDGHDAEIGQAVLLLTSSTTVSVSDAAGLEAALDGLDRYRLARGVTYTIALADGTYTFSAPLEVKHPDGAAIQIIGDITSPDAVNLTFPNDTDGVVVEQGRALGLLAGVTVSGVGPTDNEAAGILAKNGATLTLGDGVVVQSFYNGVMAEAGSSILGAPTTQGEGWLTVSECTFCVFASGSSYISAPYAVAYPDSGSAGFVAFRSSAVDVAYAVADGGYQGFVSTYGSSMWARYATAMNQESEGFHTSGVSYLDVKGGTSLDALYGVQVGAYSFASFREGSISATGSILQSEMGAIDVTDTSLNGFIQSSNNDTTDFILGN